MKQAAVYDWEDITRSRDQGLTWAEIANELPHRPDPKSLRAQYNMKRRKQEKKAFGAKPQENPGVPEPHDTPYSAVRAATLTSGDLQMLKTEEDLVRFFALDPARWEMVRCWVGGKAWDMIPEKGVVTRAHSHRITAEFRLRVALLEGIWDKAWDRFISRVEEGAQEQPKVERVGLFSPDGDPVLFTAHVYDPHLGMLGWGSEVGTNYDLKIGATDYLRAYHKLLPLAYLYPVERITYVLGHDLGHAATYGPNSRGGVTAAGTPQDMDTRLEKIYVTVFNSLVQAVELVRSMGIPLDVRMVPGNHDRPETFRWGHALSAWYRKTEDVAIHYQAMKRSFMGYGRNAIMLTHGEEYRRQRDSLPLIMATECPADLWVASEGGYREVLTGHNHIAMAGKYAPTADLNETRAIRVRSLPGLTPEDAWHFDQGYKHNRSATAIAYAKSGGPVGLHECHIRG